MIETTQDSDRGAFPAIRFDHACFGCGDDNPMGLRLQFSPTDDGVTAPFTPEPTHQGFDNVVHGGIISAVLDEAMAWATTRAGVWAVTAEISVRFKNPLEVGRPTTVTAHVSENRSKLVATAATLTRDRDGATIATATATFVRVSDALAEEWRRRYLERGEPIDHAEVELDSARQSVTLAGEE